MKDLAYTLDRGGELLVPFRLDNNNLASARQLLMQRVVMLMLTSANDYLRYEGGGLYANLKNANLSDKDLTRLQNVIGIAVTDVVSIIQGQQEQATGLSDDERLSRIALQSVSVGAPGELEVSLLVVSASGEETLAQFNLEATAV